MKRGVILDVWAARVLADRGIDVGIRDFGKKVNVSRELFEGDDIAFQGRFKARQLALDPSCDVDSSFLLDCDYLDIGQVRIPASYFYTNGNGGKFFVFSFDCYFNGEGMNRSYLRARQLRRAVERLSGRRLPAFVDGNPDLYVMVKESKCGERAVGLWNCFSDEVLSPVVELDRPYAKAAFLGCKGRLDGNRVVLEDVPAWKFAGFVVSEPRTAGLERRVAAADGDATERIQREIDDCFRVGGGVVRIAKGEHRVKSLRLRSNVTLHLERDARLVASRNPSDYDGIVQRDEVEPFDGGLLDSADRLSITSTNHWNNAIIRIYRAHDVAIVGEPGSEIDGRNCYDENGEEKYRGPHGIGVHFSSNVVCRGYTLRDAGNWSHRFCLSSDIRVEDVKVRGGHDGLDFHACDRVLVEGCDIQSGDDCVAGYDNDDMTVRRCRLNSACSVFRIGGRNILAEDIVAYGPGAFAHRYGLSEAEKRAGVNPAEGGRRNTLSFFTNYGNARVRGRPCGIVFRNCRVEGIDRLMHLNFSGNERWQTGPCLEDVTFENVDASGLLHPVTAYARRENPLRIAFKDCRMSFRTPVKEFARGANISEISIENVEFKDVEGPLLLNWEDRIPDVKTNNLRGLSPSIRKADGPFASVAI